MCWNTMPRCSARSSRSSDLDIKPTSRPRTPTFPSVGSIRRFTKRTKVDFPEPERPMMQKTWPFATLKLASRTPTTHAYSERISALPTDSDFAASNASFARAPNTFQTPSSSTTVSVSSI